MVAVRQGTELSLPFQLAVHVASLYDGGTTNTYSERLL